MFQVRLPTGAEVEFLYAHVSGYFGISYIHVKPSIIDKKISKGLCGYFDGNTKNDFKLPNGTTVQDSQEFSRQWRYICIYVICLSITNRYILSSNNDDKSKTCCNAQQTFFANN